MGLEALRGFAMPLIAFALVTVPTIPTAQARDLGVADTVADAVDSLPLCHLFTFEGTPQHPVIHPECIPAEAFVAGPGPFPPPLPPSTVLMCGVVVIAGIPPQPGLNPDCLWMFVDYVAGGIIHPG